MEVYIKKGVLDVKLERRRTSFEQVLTSYERFLPWHFLKDRRQVEARKDRVLNQVD
jgi:hypothetical protein